MTDMTEPSPGAQAVGSEGKSKLVAYLLWFFLGGLGVHRFYLGAIKTGAAQALLAISGAFLLIPLIPLFIWLIVDIFLIPRLAEEAA